MWSLLPSASQRSRTDHVPVLADEVRGLLAVTPGETVVDATFGAGGHARVLAADLKGKGRFIAIDRDSTVRPFFERFEREAGVQARFLRGELSLVLSQLGANGVEADAILLDLGVSSMQIDRPERGFSYAVDAPLDMRMDPSGPLTAQDVVNEWDERELATIFRRYGEERFARQIAQAIVRRRADPVPLPDATVRRQPRVRELLHPRDGRVRRLLQAAAPPAGRRAGLRRRGRAGRPEAGHEGPRVPDAVQAVRHGGAHPLHTQP